MASSWAVMLLRRFPQVGLEIPGVGNKNTKKSLTFEKSYFDHIYGLRNMCNRSSMIKILFLAPENTFELLFSSEIDQFEVEELGFLEILTFSFVPTVGISIKINGKS